MNPLFAGGTAQRLRLVTGLILFAFAATHFLNTALGLWSVDLMEDVQAWRLAVTRSWAGTAILLSAIIIHVTLGLIRIASRATAIGYAVPGPVVAIGVLLSLAGIDAVLDAAGIGWGAALVTGSVVGLVVAYVIRFLALATNSMEASLDKVTRSTTSSALSLGASPARVVRRIHLPLMRSGVGVALVLVAVDALKELPVVLLLRPFGFSTLAVWVYELASESLWNLVGLPALTIVAVAAVPVLLLFRAQVRVPRAGGS